MTTHSLSQPTPRAGTVQTIEDIEDGCDDGMGPGPDDMASACCGGGAGLDDGIMGGICSVCRCNIACKTLSQFSAYPGGLMMASWVGSAQSVGVTSPAKHCHSYLLTPTYSAQQLANDQTSSLTYGLKYA